MTKNFCNVNRLIVLVNLCYVIAFSIKHNPFQQTNWFMVACENGTFSFVMFPNTVVDKG